MLSVGIDAGGTFTDFVFFDGKEISVNKVPSTPRDPSIAVLNGLKTHPVEFSHISEIIHGTTVATNALLEREGAKTCLVTTRGFEDVIEIRRQNREKLYDLLWNPAAPLVLPELRFGVSERTDYRGSVLVCPDDAEVEEIKEEISSLGVEAIAVCFLHSYANPENERRVAVALSELGIPITLSSELVAEFREYERTSTTVLNSYLIPKVNKYMRSLSRTLEEKSLSIMQSNGGVISAEQAAEEPAKIVLSGPAGGVVGAFEICTLSGREKIITYDMGGTSTDISLCDGKVSFTTENTLGGVALKVPMINISTIGAGGGSVAYIADGGILKVGPRSAGADPGPACYGKGVLPTVTDANIVLGRMDPGWFLGGEMNIYPERSFEAIRSLAPDHSAEEVAESVIRISNSNMEKALRVISVGKGYDPREFSLVSFGGAGGLHACELARSLGMREVVFPRNPGALSAYGMLLADSFKDYGITFFSSADEDHLVETDRKFTDLERLACEDLEREDLKFEKRVDARYRRQSHELTISYSDSMASDFHREHERVYGYRKESSVVEIVTLRLRAYMPERKIDILPASVAEAEPRFFTKEVIFEGKSIKAGCCEREKLRPGSQFEGPCILYERTATAFIPPDTACEVDDYGSIIVTLNP